MRLTFPINKSDPGRPQIRWKMTARRHAISRLWTLQRYPDRRLVRVDHAHKHNDDIATLTENEAQEAKNA
jgi:hypothetical protein